MDKLPVEMNPDDVPEAQVVRKRGWSFQVVWLVPIVAALIGGWLVVKGIMEKGPTITITFKTAEGLEAGKTKVKYKNVDIGEVKQISLAEDLQGVVATVELVKEAESYLVEDTNFWVVRPRVAGGQVTGLGTLFSGSYIGIDIGKSETKERDFLGLEVAPIVTGDVPGHQFMLHAETLGSLQIGSPVYYRQEEVGSVLAHDLNKDGKGVTFRIFVKTPFDQYVNANTRFWNASGIDVSLDASGVRVDTQSLASILIGGVAFETLAGSAPGAPAEENQKFFLAKTRSEAMKRQDTLSLPFVLYFTTSLRGLSVGAPVDFRGITIGEVMAMNVEANETQTGFRFPVSIVIYPGRLLSMMKSRPDGVEMDEDSRRARWDRMVARGLRGQLRTGNLLTGQALVVLEFFPDASPAHMDWTNDPPVIPTVGGELQELEATLSGIMKKIEKVPWEDIGTDVRRVLVTVNRTLNRADQFVKHLDAELTPAAKSALAEARKTLKSAERTLASNSPMQYEMQDTLRELNRASRSLRLLTEALERNPEALIRGK
ncbi:MAG: intermembrane transport protein PqiB [Nitrospirales bacterium]|nr:MlaD family protein [Nitrospirales bacterium]